MKICVECNYHEDAGTFWNDYKHECHAPSERDPVTGKGHTDCRAKNPDGKCKDYKAKEKT